MKLKKLFVTFAIIAVFAVLSISISAGQIFNSDKEITLGIIDVDSKPIVADEFSDLHQNHHKFLDFLCELHTEERAKQAPLHQENMEHEPTDEEIIESLSQFLRETFGAIVIGVIRV